MSAAAGPTPDIELLHVTRTFGDRRAVDDLSLSVARGSILGLIGPSGSGKTTTIRMLTGALRATSGTVRVLGHDPTRFPRRTREVIGYMPQLLVLDQDLTAREALDFSAALFGLVWSRRHRRTREMLRLVELDEAAGRQIRHLSGGMQRRLELACALVHDPRLIILDEPTAGIDPVLRLRLWEELHRLRDDGRTLVVTTQYVSEAEYCDEVALMSDGELIAFADPMAIRRMALGGDQIDFELTDLFDIARLPVIPGVQGISQSGPRAFSVIVDDAAAALPLVIEAVTEAGASVASSHEVQPAFDEVFARLVTAHRAAGGVNGDPG